MSLLRSSRPVSVGFAGARVFLVTALWVAGSWCLLSMPARAQGVIEVPVDSGRSAENEPLVTEDISTQQVDPPESEQLGDQPIPVHGPESLSPIITKIEIRSDAPIDRPSDLADLITVPIGEPLDGALLRRSLRNIQATGLAYEVDAFLRDEAGGLIQDEAGGLIQDERRLDPGEASEVEVVDAVGADPETAAMRPELETAAMRPELETAAMRPGAVLVVVVRAALQLEAVEIAGEFGINLSTLRGRLEARAGEPLLEDRLVRGVFSLQDLYRDRGYFEATVRLGVETDDARKRAQVTYRVESGPRAKINEVRFDGDLGPFGQAELIDPLKGEPGKEYRARTTKEDAERLRKWLIERSYRAATVKPPVVEYSTESKRVDVAFDVVIGPKIDVRIVGAKRKELEKRDLLPFLGDDGYDEALVLQAVGRIERYFQERGHYQAEVDWREETPAPDQLQVILEIDQGPVLTLEALEFTGNVEYSDETLDLLFTTEPKRLLSLGSGRLVESVLDEDLSNLRSFYALEGFVGTEVGPPQIEAIGSNPNSLKLTVPIVEGSQRRVVDLDLEGVSSLDVDQLRSGLALAPGGPFHPLLLEESLDQVVGRYTEAGFEAVQVSAREDWDADRRLVDVTFEIFEGPRTEVGRVIVRGNLETKTEVIENALEIETGEPISRTRLLEVERRLYRLGIFSRVEVDLVPAPLGSTTRDVLVKVSEGRTRRLIYGVGYDYDGEGLNNDPHGVGGLLGFSQNNLFGRAYTLQFDLRARTNDQLARVVLDQPTIGGRPISMIYSLSHQREDRQSYSVERSIARVEAFRLFDRSRLGLGFDFRQVASEIAPLPASGTPDDVVIERADQNIEISSLVPSYSIDFRDDPIDPTTGWSAQARLQYAFPFLDTKADFLKVFGQVTGFHPFGRYGGLAGSVRLGVIEPFAGASADLRDAGSEGTIPENLKIPIDERFFAGGAYSHRAFEQDELGIPGVTVFGTEPRGGNGLILLNFDYRFPVFGGLDGVVFFDAGNLWEGWKDVDLGDLRPGAGLGVRYRSPIGPIRAAIAWKLDREEGESAFVFVLALGNPF